MSQKRGREGDDSACEEGTRKRKRSRQGSVPNVPSGPFSDEDEVSLGIIEKVTLKNFMCHSNLEFTFGTDTRVHFITGSNGSGKSAVLNGIILALGGKSSLTQRNTNIRKFIQNGKHVADLSVTLCNYGKEAYKPKEYGNRIIISRRISDEGGSTYKICNEAGKVVSQKKEEINSILHDLNIQIENPVCILTQEASRSFLESKDARQKYDFFLKATQLEEIYQFYVDSEKQCDEAKMSCKKKLEAKKELYMEVNRWEQQARNLESLDKTKEKVKELENEMVWSSVKLREEEERQLRAVRDQNKISVDEAEEIFQEAARKLGEYDEMREKLQSTQHEKNAELRNILKTLTGLDHNHGKVVIDLKTAKSRIDRLKRDIDNENRQIENLRKSIEELKARSMHDIDEEKRKREMEIKMLESANAELKATLQEADPRKENINNQKMIHSNRVDEINLEIKDLESQIEGKHREISRMKDSQRNREYLFGRNMPELRRRIAEAAQRGQFRRKPIGPIGLYLKITDQNWAFAVERCLGGKLLQSFCADNMGDRKLLMDIIKSVYGSREMWPSVIVSPFLDRVHDVQGHKVMSPYPTIFDLLECDDANVHNCLIDQKSIETVILIENNEVASNVMMDSPPKNCSSAFTVVGDQVYPRPQYVYYSFDGKSGIRYLQPSFTDADIRAKSEEASYLQKQRGIKIAEKEEHRNKIAECTREIDNLNNHMRRIKQQLKFNEEKIKNLQIVEDHTDVTAQEQDLKKRELMQEKIINELNSSSNDFEQLKEQKRQCDADRYKLLNESREKRKELDDLMDKIRSTEVQWEKKRSDKDQKSKSVKAAKQKLHESETVLAAAEKETKAAVELALKLGPRIETDKKPAFIRNEIDQLQSELDNHISAFDRDSIRRNFLEKKNAYEKLGKEIDKSISEIRTLKKIIKIRLEKYKELRSLTSVRVKILFNMHMALRDYVGSVSFNHDKGILEIEANVNGPSLHKTNCLSGGERSFVTVSLLMALFEVTDMPFHILDEYDVFMDRTNKDASMNLMMEKAKEQSRNQFIFITPLDLSNSVDVSSVKIHRLKDPERKALKKN